MKMMLMNLVYRYEFKYPDGVTSRPENGKGHHTMLPCSNYAPLVQGEEGVWFFS
jgi:ent-kaurene oxidase